MFIVLYALSRKKTGASPGDVLRDVPHALYGIFRILIEFVRVPDAQLGYLWGPITMGQVLSLPLVIAGIVILVLAHRLGRPQVGHLDAPIKDAVVRDLDDEGDDTDR
jgi:phosphatidylglycerol:prolipoprotein diacylglycerol transferase